MTTVLNKLDAAEKQLEAALYLHLKCFPPEPVHTLIGAARGILYGLAKHKKNGVLTKWDTSILFRVVGGDEKRAREYQNEVANFLKHADRDPEGQLTIPNLPNLNLIELQLCILALTQIKKPISRKLDKGLWFLGLSPNAILPFDAIAAAQFSIFNSDQIRALKDEVAFKAALIEWLEPE